MASVGQLQQQLSAANTTISSLQSQLDAANATIGSLQQQVTSLQAQLATANAKVTSLQSQLATVQSQLSAAQAQITALTAERDSLKTQVATLNATVASLQAQLAAVTTPTPTPTPTPAPSGDFATRIQAPGVIQFASLTDPAMLGKLIQTSSDWTGVTFGWGTGNATNPIIDADGLLFTIPSMSPANAGGSWTLVFPRDFGENSSLFVQAQVRWNDVMQSTVFQESTGTPQPGIKFFDVGAFGSTNTTSKIVVQTYYQQRFPQLYQYGSSGGDGMIDSLTNPTDYAFQNQMPSPFCRYSSTGTATSRNGCKHVADKEVTLQLGVEFGAKRMDSPYDGLYTDARVRLWMQAEGETTATLVHDWNKSTPGYVPIRSDAGPLRMLNIFPYMTRKDPNQITGIGLVRWRNVIVGTQRIPDVAYVAAPLPDPIPTPTPTPTPGAYPAWRQGKPVNQLIEIAGSSLSKLPGTTEGQLNAWNGMGKLGTRWFNALGGGHGESENNVNFIDFAADSPKFVMLDPGTVGLDTRTRYYTDGRPQSRHTYQTTQGVEAAHSTDGKERIVLPTCSAAYSLNMLNPDGSQAYGNAPDVEAFDVAGKVWEHGWPSMPNLYLIPIVARDPRNSDIWVHTGGETVDGANVNVLRAATRQWEIFIPSQIYPSATRIIPWLNMGAVFDGKRGRLVSLLGDLRLNYLDTATRQPGWIQTSGMPAHGPWRYPLVHDLDNDRYVYLRCAGAPYSGIVEFWGINPDSGAATIITTTNQCPEVTLENRAEYFPELGGIAYMPRYESNLFFLPTR